MSAIPGGKTNEQWDAVLLKKPSTQQHIKKYWIKKISEDTTATQRMFKDQCVSDNIKREIFTVANNSKEIKK